MFHHFTNINKRLKNSQWGRLKGRGLRKAERIVDKFGSISTSGQYGSVEIAEQDFIPEVKK
jgi:hypothetical protein